QARQDGEAKIRYLLHLALSFAATDHRHRKETAGARRRFPAGVPSSGRRKLSVMGAFAVGPVEDAPGDEDVDALAGGEPDPRGQGTGGEDLLLPCRQG